MLDNLVQTLNDIDVNNERQISELYQQMVTFVGDMISIGLEDPGHRLFLISLSIGKLDDAQQNALNEKLLVLSDKFREMGLNGIVLMDIMMSIQQANEVSGQCDHGAGQYIKNLVNACAYLKKQATALKRGADYIHTERRNNMLLIKNSKLPVLESIIGSPSDAKKIFERQAKSTAVRISRLTSDVKHGETAEERQSAKVRLHMSQQYLIWVSEMMAKIDDLSIEALQDLEQSLAQECAALEAQMATIINPHAHKQYLIIEEALGKFDEKSGFLGQLKVLLKNFTQNPVSMEPGLINEVKDTVQTIYHEQLSMPLKNTTMPSGVIDAFFILLEKMASLLGVKSTQMRVQDYSHCFIHKAPCREEQVDTHSCSDIPLTKL